MASLGFLRPIRSAMSGFRRWPVRWQLTLVSASLTFAILLVSGGVVGTLVAQRVRSDFNQELEEAASHLVGRTRIIEQGFAEPVVYSPDLNDVSLPNDASARVISTSGEVLNQAPENGPNLGPAKPGISTHGSLTVAAQPVLGPNSQVVGYIQYARDNSQVAATITKLWLFILGGIVGGTVLAVLAGLALASRAMKPISKLTETAREVTTTRDPSRRLPEPAADDEVGELTTTLQQMLNALDASRAEREATMQKQREFVADASHELRTPLTSILANLELLEIQLANAGNREEHEIISSAVRSSKRMSRLVSDLLVLARSDAGQHRVTTELDLADIAKSAVREITPSLEGGSIDASDCASARVQGNQDELHRLVLNLIDNAVRYAGPEPRIVVRTTADADGGEATIEVADDGPGIPAEMRERVFERFVRDGSGSDTTGTEGTGLGLSMVQAIARAHGGDAEAKGSIELGGAKLVVSIPLAGSLVASGRGGGRDEARSG